MSNLTPDELARLRLKAKKLRREAQAARTKAYADALVTVFPEVKDMGSAEEVLDFVKGLKPGTGHGTPDACSALLDDAPARNDATEDEALSVVLRRIYIMGW